MKTISTRNLPTEQIDVLDQFASTDAGPEMRDLLQSIIELMRAGDDIAPATASTTLTPSEAAKRLGMSRSHLYKLLDRGDLPFHNVGRDRRIKLHDLIAFEEQRQHDRRELAEKFAFKSETRESAIDELAGMM